MTGEPVAYVVLGEDWEGIVASHAVYPSVAAAKIRRAEMARDDPGTTFAVYAVCPVEP